VVLGKSNGTALGGRLLEAHVRPTLEVMLIESRAHCGDVMMLRAAWL